MILYEPEEMVVRRLGPECTVNAAVPSRSSEPHHAHTISAGLCVIVSQDIFPLLDACHIVHD